MESRVSRVAAVYDIHGNLPALEAVLPDIERAGADLVVVGGDVASGPMPAEVLDLLTALGENVRFVRGNADREVVLAYDHNGSPVEDDPAERSAAWAASRLSRQHRDLLASFSGSIVVEIEGLGEVLFCHGSPRIDEEILTSTTPDSRLREILSGVDQDLVVCGHTHAQFDRRTDHVRIVNAGSVGLPYQGTPVSAFWLLLGPEVEFRHSDYDLKLAVEQIRATGYTEAEDTAESLLDPPNPIWVAELFEQQATDDPPDTP